MVIYQENVVASCKIKRYTLFSFYEDVTYFSNYNDFDCIIYAPDFLKYVDCLQQALLVVAHSYYSQNAGRARSSVT